MDTKNGQFEEQDHPLKNTDHAFVQVGKNGEPVIPTDNEQANKVNETNEEGRNTERK